MSMSARELCSLNAAGGPFAAASPRNSIRLIITDWQAFGRCARRLAATQEWEKAQGRQRRTLLDRMAAVAAAV